MNNLRLYEQLAQVPEEAKRAITGGKLKGKTDINPMWRIKALTEAFGPQGSGWVCPIKRLWTEPGAGGEVSAWALCELTYKREDGSWSEPITGVGGSMLVQLEKGVLVTNDEAYKMAYTDAISVAAKGLGAGASVYWEKDASKYRTEREEPQGAGPEALQELAGELSACGLDIGWALAYVRSKTRRRVEAPEDLTGHEARGLAEALRRKRQEAPEGEPCDRIRPGGGL